MSDIESLLRIQQQIINKITEKTVNKLITECKQNCHEHEIEGYKLGRKFLVQCLEQYREEKAESHKKWFIDFLVEKHKKSFVYKHDEFYKVRHNLLVMTYMLKESYSKRKILQELKITEAVYQRNLEKGIDELMILAFGIYGLH